jgi:hypothetical protein
MLKPVNPVANRVAEGRRVASRSIVLTSQSAVSSYVFRRSVVPAVAGESREETVWEGGMVLSDHEEHATEYAEQGYAMVLFDKFSGGSCIAMGTTSIAVKQSYMRKLSHLIWMTTAHTEKCWSIRQTGSLKRGCFCAGD